MEPLSPDDPARLAHYRLEARLGAGGMGRVYLGRTPDKQPAAIKVIHPGLAADPHFRARFAREIATARSVRTPWTADVLDADPHAPHPWLATEYIAGPSLDQVVTASGPLPGPAIRRLAGGLTDALAALHDTGVVHRDLKPSNVLLADDGPRLIDFGIARAIDSTSITHTGHTVGTPAFMSPEQALGEDAGTPSDVFSLAAVLTYAATGAGPFGHTANPVAMLLRVTQQEPDLSAVPEGLRPVLAECLAKDPALRPTARELSGRLAPPARDTATIAATRAQLPLAGATQPLLAAPVPPPAAGTSPDEGRRDGWRPWMGVLNGGLAVVLVAVWLVFLANPPNTAGPPVPVPIPEARTVQVATVRTGGSAERVVMSPDGRLLYSVGTGNGLSVLDVAAGAPAAPVPLPAPATDVAFSPDGRRAYVGLWAGSVAVVDTTSATVLATVPVGEAPQQVVATPDGRTVYTSFFVDATVSAIDTATNRVRATIPGNALTRAAEISPDGRSLYVYDGQTESVSVLDTATNTFVATIPAESVTEIVFSPDGGRVHLLHNSGVVTVLDAARRTPLGTLGTLGFPSAMAVTPDGRHLLVTTVWENRGTLVVIDTATFLVVERVPLDAAQPRGLGVTSDGSRACVIDGTTGTAFVLDISAYQG